MVAGHIVGVTGPRALKIADKDTKQSVTKWMLQSLEMMPVEFIFSGLAEGFDELAVLAAHKLGIEVIGLLPSHEYGPYYWGENSVTQTDRTDDFNNLLQMCADVKTICGHHMFGRANRERNQYMVDNIDVLLAYNDTNSRGTQHCLGLVADTKISVQYYPELQLGGRPTSQELGLSW